jgi:hypothetical protein
MKPYSSNKYGHANKCECTKCIKLKVAKYAARVEAMTEIRAPAHPGAYVPVRAHFRRTANYLQASKKLRKAVTRWYAKKFT